MEISAGSGQQSQDGDLANPDGSPFGSSPSNRLAFANTSSPGSAFVGPLQEPPVQPSSTTIDPASFVGPLQNPPSPSPTSTVDPGLLPTSEPIEIANNVRITGGEDPLSGIYGTTTFSWEHLPGLGVELYQGVGGLPGLTDHILRGTLNPESIPFPTGFIRVKLNVLQDYLRALSSGGQALGTSAQLSRLFDRAVGGANVDTARTLQLIDRLIELEQDASRPIQANNIRPQYSVVVTMNSEDLVEFAAFAARGELHLWRAETLDFRLAFTQPLANGGLFWANVAFPLTTGVGEFSPNAGIPFPPPQDFENPNGTNNLLDPPALTPVFRVGYETPKLRVFGRDIRLGSGIRFDLEPRPGDPTLQLNDGTVVALPEEFGPILDVLGEFTGAGTAEEAEHNGVPTLEPVLTLDQLGSRILAQFSNGALTSVGLPELNEDQLEDLEGFVEATDKALEAVNSSIRPGPLTDILTTIYALKPGRLTGLGLLVDYILNNVTASDPRTITAEKSGHALDVVGLFTGQSDEDVFLSLRTENAREFQDITAAAWDALQSDVISLEDYVELVLTAFATYSEGNVLDPAASFDDYLSQLQTVELGSIGNTATFGGRAFRESLQDLFIDKGFDLAALLVGYGDNRGLLEQDIRSFTDDANIGVLGVVEALYQLEADPALSGNTALYTEVFDDIPVVRFALDVHEALWNAGVLPPGAFVEHFDQINGLLDRAKGDLSPAELQSLVASLANDFEIDFGLRELAQANEARPTARRSVPPAEFLYNFENIDLATVAARSEPFLRRIDEAVSRDRETAFQAFELVRDGSGSVAVIENVTSYYLDQGGDPFDLVLQEDILYNSGGRPGDDLLQKLFAFTSDPRAAVAESVISLIATNRTSIGSGIADFDLIGPRGILNAYNRAEGGGIPSILRILTQQSQELAADGQSLWQDRVTLDNGTVIPAELQRRVERLAVNFVARGVTVNFGDPVLADRLDAVRGLVSLVPPRDVADQRAWFISQASSRLTSDASLSQEGLGELYGLWLSHQRNGFRENPALEGALSGGEFSISRREPPVLTASGGNVGAFSDAGATESGEGQSTLDDDPALAATFRIVEAGGAVASFEQAYADAIAAGQDQDEALQTAAAASTGPIDALLLAELQVDVAGFAEGLDQARVAGGNSPLTDSERALIPLLIASELREGRSAPEALNVVSALLSNGSEQALISYLQGLNETLEAPFPIPVDAQFSDAEIRDRGLLKLSQDIDQALAVTDSFDNPLGGLLLQTLKTAVVTARASGDGIAGNEISSFLREGGETFSRLVTLIGEGDLAAFGAVISDVGTTIAAAEAGEGGRGAATTGAAMQTVGSTLQALGQRNQDDGLVIAGLLIGGVGDVIYEAGQGAIQYTLPDGTTRAGVRPVLNSDGLAQTDADGNVILEEFDAGLNAAVAGAQAVGSVLQYLGSRGDDEFLSAAGIALSGGFDAYRSFVNGDQAAGNAGVIRTASSVIGTLIGGDAGRVISGAGSIASDVVLINAGQISPGVGYANIALTALDLIGVDVPPQARFIVEGALSIAAGPVGWAAFVVGIAFRLGGMGSFTEVTPLVENIDADGDGLLDDNAALRQDFRRGFFGGVSFKGHHILYDVNGVNPLLLDGLDYRLEVARGGDATIDVDYDNDDGLEVVVRYGDERIEGELITSQGDRLRGRQAYRGYFYDDDDSYDVESATFRGRDSNGNEVEFAVDVEQGSRRNYEPATFTLAAGAVPDRFFVNYAADYRPINPSVGAQEVDGRIEVSAAHYNALVAELGAPAGRLTQGAAQLQEGSFFGDLLAARSVEFKGARNDPNLYQYLDMNGDGLPDLVRIGLQTDGLKSEGDGRIEVTLLDADLNPLKGVPSILARDFGQAEQLSRMSEILTLWVANNPEDYVKGVDLRSVYNRAVEEGVIDELVELTDLRNELFLAVVGANPDIDILAVTERIGTITDQIGGLFDVSGYTALHGDVEAFSEGNTLVAAYHYINHGNREGRPINASGEILAEGRPPAVPGLIYHGTGTLETGERLESDEYVLSENGRFALVFHRDGRLVQYDTAGGGREPVWEALRSGNTNDGFVQVQRDGNFVVYDDDRDAEWSTDTYNRDGGVNRPFSVVVQNDGNIVLRDSIDNAALWASRNVPALVTVPLRALDRRGFDGWSISFAGRTITGRVEVDTEEGRTRNLGPSGYFEVGRDDYTKATLGTFVGDDGERFPVTITYEDNNDYERAVFTADIAGNTLWQGEDGRVARARRGIQAQIGATGEIVGVPGITLRGTDRLSGRMGFDEGIVSKDGQHVAIFHADGRFLTYQNHGGILLPTWEADRSGNTNHGYVDMQRDGNFVIYDDDGDAEFDTSTYNRDGDANRRFELVIQNTGALVVIDTQGDVPLWRSTSGKLGEAAANTPTPAEVFASTPPSTGPVVGPVQQPTAAAPASPPEPANIIDLLAGIRSIGNTLTGRMTYDLAIVSNNGGHAAVFHEDGRFVVYRQEGGRLTKVWEADRDGNTNHGFVQMQNDGNFVVYDDDRDAEFDTGTYNRDVDRPFSLVMQDDGNLVIYDSLNNDALWSIQTGRIGVPVSAG
ncbi:MAG: hypothetical protein AAF416_04715 [Pseudomonadota bacterium]